MSSTISATEAEAQRGLMAVAGGFLIWGLLPLYLKPLSALAALEVAAWRYLLGLTTILLWMRWRGELPALQQALQNWALLRRLLLTGTLLAVNWTLYAFSVTSHQVLLSSLGYFINPLFNVLLGVLVLSERLNRTQWVAVGLAALAVSWLTFHTGQLPWLALALASSFSLYGLFRKTTPVTPLTGLAIETLLGVPFALLFLLFMPHAVAPRDYSALMWLLVLLSGIVTVVPLTLFNYGVQRIHYATTGMLQYIAPVLQFIIAVLVYREPLSSQRLVGFVLIWAALGIYAGDGLWRARRRPPQTF